MAARTGWHAERIHVGPGRIFVDVDVPVDPLDVIDANGEPDSGSEVGYTQGDSVFTYTPTKTDIMAEQSMGVIDTFLETEAGELTFTALERDYYVLTALFDNVNTTLNPAVGPSPGPAATGSILFKVGGIYPVASHTVMLVSPRRVTGLLDVVLYEVVFLYKAQSVNPIPLTFSRATPSTVAASFRAIHDGSRAIGDQMFFYLIQLSEAEDTDYATPPTLLAAAAARKAAEAEKGRRGRGGPDVPAAPGTPGKPGAPGDAKPGQPPPASGQAPPSEGASSTERK